LPVLDLSPFLTPGSSVESKRTAAAALNAACRDVGFFYLQHKLPGTLEADALAAAHTFFTTTPTPDKTLLSRGTGARGYQKLGENVTGGAPDAHEALDFYRPSTSAAHGILCGDNLWPSQPGFRDTFSAFWDALRELGDAVMVAMAWALGYEGAGEDGEEVLLRHTREGFWVARVIGYPPLQGELAAGKGVSCGEHTDYGCTTFLYADATRGALQVQTRGGDWIDADPRPGCCVVNVGDMMEVWTNGLWRSTLHRVIHRGDKMRVSVPFFYEPDFEAVVKPLGRCVEATGGVERYGSVVYGEHLLGKVGGNFY
ncbi:hypothetical protein EDC01DRAFT_608466, partial [Geopyxis carbonaria]